MDRQLRESTMDLLRLIKRPRPYFARWFGRDDRLPLFAEVGGSGEIAAIPHLVEHLCDADTTAAASGAIFSLLSTASPEELVWLDEEVRGFFAYAMNWSRRLQASQAQSLLEGLPTDGQRLAFLGILSMHCNGHIREWAVRQLAKSEESSAVRFLLIRINDWVPQVCNIAVQSINERLSSGESQAVMQNPYLILRLADCRRFDHSELIDAYWRIVVEPANRQQLLELLENESPIVRQGCYRSAMRLTGDHCAPIVRAALNSRDVVVRAWGARDARAFLSDAELQVVVRQLKSDTFMPVRREGIVTILERFPSQSTVALESGMTDRNPSIRQFSRFWLQKRGVSDFALRYRERVAAGDNLIVAIAGLGETGSQDDAPIVAQYLSSPEVAIRAAAVRTVGRLALADYADQLADALSDASRVCIEARNALRAEPGLIPLKKLWTIFETSTRQASRFAALDLIQRNSFWDAFPYLLRIVGGLDLECARIVDKGIRRRMVQLFTSPTHEQRQRIDEALESCERTNTALARECRTWLASLR